MQVTFITSAAMCDEKFAMAKPLLQPVIEQAARGEFTVADIERMTRQGRAITAIAQVDGLPVMAMAFEFVHYPQQLAVNVMALGGRGLDFVAEQFWQEFRTWCKSAGATVIEASCSDAMARMLQRYGFDCAYRVVRAPL